MSSEPVLKRYVIVRDMPDIETKNTEELGNASAASNAALGKVGHGRVQWQHSYVVEGKTFCVYLAENEQAIRDHGAVSGVPITSIHEVVTIIDPTTAANCRRTAS